MGKKCQICKKKCSGEIVRSDGDKYFHIECFSCKSKKCQICKKKCSGEIVRSDGDKYFHIECFSCKTCGRSLSDAGFYVNADGAYVCPDHVQRPQSAASEHQTPSKKDQKKKESKKSRKSDVSLPLSIDSEATSRQHRESIATSLGSPGGANTCAGCGDHLQSGQILLALGTSWHVWCFKCSECAAVLQGEYMSHNGRPLCLRDYNQKFGVKCCECDRFIAGRVLEAGGYKFHPTCARCSRCQLAFEDGAEMYMQGNEIWHPNCEHYRTTENIALAKPAAAKGTKFQAHFGQHLTYMYMLPETEQTYLKHPIAPNPPQPAQFHMPQGPVIKIRKSRYSMLKTGMQRLTEDLERTRPSSRSPSLDNEEPIELAHYPGAKVPDPNAIPPIDREDFPAPPYPYAVEELKRRLSSSSVENDDDEEEELQMAAHNMAHREQKQQKKVQVLDTIGKDSSIAHVIKQNLVEDSERQQRQGADQRLHWDPRNASRTPSAKKMPHLKFRYDTPINASPSRHLNRPKPWVFWRSGDDNRAATTTIPCWHLPQSRMGTLLDEQRAATMPDSYGYYAVRGADGRADTTISSHYSDHSLDMSSIGGAAAPPDMRATLRTSLPDMSRPVKTYTFEELQTSNKLLPEDVDRQHLERHLGREEFERLFEMTPIEFYKLPEWKRINLKRKLKLF